MNKRKKRKMKKIVIRMCIFVMTVVCLASAFLIIGKSSVSAGASETSETYYTSISVEYGDTLSAIAAEYGMSVKELKEINNLESSTIYAGEALIVSYTK